ncbi:MAG: hypothetical protein DWH78_06030 [Planctomycetota bacterium]|nr:MAG: hypothetical protein DWH78_06030 [Planctomycetota bacterium]
MSLQLQGPFDVIPSCHLWISEDDRGVCPERNDEAATSIMDARDRQRWQRFRPAEKKHQFLSSRLAVRNVLDHEFRSSEAKAHFTADDSGRPMVTSTDGKELCRISLSHSSCLTAVVIVHGTTKVGVDIETFGDTRPAASSSLGISLEEVTLLHQLTGIDTKFCSTAVWTIKEAVWKAFEGARFVLPSKIKFEQNSAGTLSWRFQAAETDDQGPLMLFIPPNIFHPGVSEDRVTRLPTEFQTHFIGCVALRPHPAAANQLN